MVNDKIRTGVHHTAINAATNVGQTTGIITTIDMANVRDIDMIPDFFISMGIDFRVLRLCIL